MFAVIISEKGGAERREAFDKTEINVGRVQGNELMLPKGNVSKRHARLLFRDGRFIVTDLKSTNGTYVNGRKIAQATIVREGDKIYIGDFVLRIESSAGGSGQVATASPPPEDPGVQSLDGPAADLTSGPSLSHASVVGPLPGPPSDPPSSRQSSPNADTGSSPRVRLPSLPGAGGKPQGASDRQIPRPPEPVISSTGSSDPSREIISHFPLENDPDDASGVSVPAPPRVPMTAGPRVTDIGMAPPPLGSRPPGPSGLPPRAPPVKPPVSNPPRERGSQPGVATPPPLIENPRTPSREGLPPFVPGPATIAAPAPSSGFGGGSDVPRPPLVQSQAHTGDRGLKPPPLPSDSQRGGMRRALPPASDRVQEPPATPARRLAVRAVLEPVVRLFGPPAAEKVDDARAAELDRALADAAAALKARGEVPPGIELDALLLDARRELFELGPLTSLLDDEDVTEIHVMAHDYVVGVHGRRHIPSEVGFTSEAAVETVLRRLCAAAGQPLQPDERFVERRLARGARLFVVRPTAADQGHMMVIRKPQRADLTLEDLVRSGTVSRAMAGLLQQCVAARANILVTGAIGSGATSLLGALAAAGSTDDRVVVLQEDDELIFNQPHTISILLGSDAVENTRAVQAAARIRPDRLVVGAFAGAVAAEMVDAMGDGVDGVLAAARAPTLRQAGPRLAADLAATRPGVPADTAREWLVSAFDLAVEIGRLRDGRHRVMRIAELTIQNGAIVPRDVFTFTVERTAAGGAVEGAFHPTGVIPGIVEDLAARGVQIDQSIFGRHPSSR